ncbi:MAG: lysophospholipid acyltransferase family protein [Candidatus Omnitrophota bacterium]|nr:lysophospholipid acyltransferase family protein [Candidatus Omnitrophota bacterium]
MSQYLQYQFIRAIAFFLSLLPPSFAIWCARRAGDFIFFCMRKRRRIALDNINKAFGDSLAGKDKWNIVRTAFQSMVISVIELFTVERIKSHADESFTLVGNEHLEQAFAKGRGAVLVISHLGSWEYLSFLPYLTGKNWSVVVKDIRNPCLNDYIRKLRIITTVQPIGKTNSMRPILKELKANHGVAILIDQWAGSDGLWLDFFDEKTSTTSIPARLAKKTGCALIPAYCLRKSSGKYEIEIHAPVPFDPKDENWERVTTDKLNQLLEEQIKKYPKQWLWVHRRWKKQPSRLREL